MKNLIFVLSFLSVFIIFSSCSDDFDDIAQIAQPIPVVDVEEDPDATVETISNSAILSDDQTTKVEGTSKLSRRKDNIEIVFEASNIPNLDIKGHVVTLWAAIYRSVDDYKNDPLKLNPYSLYLVDSFIASDFENSISFNGTIEIGSNSKLMKGAPMINPKNNVVLLYAKSNGKASSNTKRLWAQQNSFSGGCQDDPDGGGPTACHEFLFSLHSTK